MLADKVGVNIFGRLSKNLYSGYINSDKPQQNKAYVLSEKPVDEYFKGVVIAIATFGEDNVYDQHDATGFINLYGLPTVVQAKVNGKNGK